MSGFLTRLLARSFGRVETIRPHVPSLFEPFTAQQAPVTPAGFDAATDMEESVASDAGLTAAGRRIARLDERAVVHGQNLTAADGRGRAAEDTQQNLATKPDDGAAKRLRTPPLQVSATVGNVHRGSGRLPPESSRPSLQACVEPLGFREGTSSREQANLREPSHSIGLSTAVAPRPPNILPVRASASLPPTAAREPVHFGPLFDQQRPQGLQRSAEPEPTIQVTIGRIEVRADASSSPPNKERPAPKPMSLDEYLRLRAGRER
jgi:hypothetical protein